MFLYKKSPVGIELFSHVKTFFYSKQFAKLLTTWLKTIYSFDVNEFIFHCFYDDIYYTTTASDRLQNYARSLLLFWYMYWDAFEDHNLSEEG